MGQYHIICSWVNTDERVLKAIRINFYATIICFYGRVCKSFYSNIERKYTKVILG